jgi:hypothetical protein
MISQTVDQYRELFQELDSLQVDMEIVITSPIYRTHPKILADRTNSRDGII